MIQPIMINSVIEWERQLEFEEQRRKEHRSEPCINYLAAPQPCREERKSILAGIFQHRNDRNESRAPVDFVRALKF